MSTAVAVRPLAELAAGVRDAHAEVEEHGRTMVEAAIRAGDLLTEAKAQVAHGAWLPWLAENFPADARTAQRYIAFSSNATRVSHLTSVREAVAELTTPREADPEPEIRGQTDLVEEVDAEVVPDTEPEPAPRLAAPAPSTPRAAPTKPSRPIQLPKDAETWAEDDIACANAIIAGRAVAVTGTQVGAWLSRYDETLQVFVDRGRWSNPFVAGEDGDAAEVVALYAEHYLPYKPALSIADLRGKALRFVFTEGAEAHARYLASLANGEGR